MKTKLKCHRVALDGAARSRRCGLFFMRCNRSVLLLLTLAGWIPFSGLAMRFCSKVECLKGSFIPLPVEGWPRSESTGITMSCRRSRRGVHSRAAPQSLHYPGPHTLDASWPSGKGTTPRKPDIVVTCGSPALFLTNCPERIAENEAAAKSCRMTSKVLSYDFLPAALRRCADSSCSNGPHPRTPSLAS